MEDDGPNGMNEFLRIFRKHQKVWQSYFQRDRMLIKIYRSECFIHGASVTHTTKFKCEWRPDARCCYVFVGKNWKRNYHNRHYFWCLSWKICLLHSVLCDNVTYICRIHALLHRLQTFIGKCFWFGGPASCMVSDFIAWASSRSGAQFTTMSIMKMLCHAIHMPVKFSAKTTTTPLNLDGWSRAVERQNYDRCVSAVCVCELCAIRHFNVSYIIYCSVSSYNF